jgi:superfamily I DNA/RNA helicase
MLCTGPLTQKGTEFPVVIIPLCWSQAESMYRSLVYTAVTRARRKVILVGDPLMLEYSSRYVGRNQRRWTRLRQLLSSGLAQPDDPVVRAEEQLQVESGEDAGPHG